jgi:predicted enzyme related to lactoylglutathione lyase
VIVFFAVEDIDAAARRVVELGGEVDEAGEDGESGRFLYSCRDDQGVKFGLHQPPA